jgi:hypothetical protein
VLHEGGDARKERGDERAERASKDSRVTHTDTHTHIYTHTELELKLLAEVSHKLRKYREFAHKYASFVVQRF